MPDAIGIRCARRELLLHRQRHFQRQWRHRIDEDLAVIRHRLAMIAMIPHGHALAAVAADRESLEQGRPFARRTPPPIGTAGLGIYLETAQILFVLVPGDIAGYESLGSPFNRTSLAT